MSRDIFIFINRNNPAEGYYTDRFSVFVGYKLAAVSYLMHDAELIFRVWKDCIYCTAKSCKIVMASYENVRNTTVFQV